MLLEEKIATMIEPVLDAMSFRLVRVMFSSGTLQIMAEPLDDSLEMTVEDCAKISRGVSAVLDVEDPIKSGYQLEVSSPGLSRPLVRPEDYTRFAGELARISMKSLIEGRRRFNGRINGITGDGQVELETGYGPVSLPFEMIDTAKLDPTEWFLQPVKAKKKG
jgi:ribosome maturation factor RimP